MSEIIESPRNPKIREARALHRKKERRRSGRVLVEGLRLVQDAAAAGAAIHYLFHTPAALQDARIAALVAAHEERAFGVSDPLMAEMTQTVHPQGIAAVLTPRPPAWPTAPTLLLVLDQLRDPGNVGTLLRAAAAAGVDGVLLSRGSSDPWNDKALRAGMGAHFRLPIQSNLTWEAMAPLLEGLVVRLADEGAEIPYDEADWRRPSALVVGGEAGGASDRGRARADEQIVIPMANQVDSLNAAVAAAVVLFEAGRQRRKEGT